jgi:hydroxymethylglutaryl-CoA lyase
MTEPHELTIRDVGPRDGLQPEAPVSPKQRARLTDRLLDAGLREVEVAAFVSPRRVPAMAGAAEVLAAVQRRKGVRLWALVPNERGAADALAADADALTVTVSASPTYSTRNVGKPVDESVEEVGAIVRQADGVVVDVVISCAFGSVDRRRSGSRLAKRPQ